MRRAASTPTPSLGKNCEGATIRQFPFAIQSLVIEDVLDGVLQVGQPVILKAPASASDPSQDTIPHRRPVTDWYADGMVSAAVNAHYGSLPGVQIEAAPYGVPSGLCVALAQEEVVVAAWTQETASALREADLVAHDAKPLRLDVVDDTLLMAYLIELYAGAFPPWLARVRLARGTCTAPLKAASFRT